MARPTPGFSTGEAVVTLESFLPRMLPNAVGCTEPLALQALLDSAIEFCHRSVVVTATLDPMVVQADVSTYPLDLPAGTAVEHVLRVWYRGNLLSAAPYETATALYSRP